MVKMRTETVEINNYQREARKTAVYPNLGDNLWYPALGLSGEAGEVAEKIKKVYRDDGGVVSPEKRDEVKKELGDVLWYIANIAVELNITLEEVATYNLQKLADRSNRHVIQGSGDNR